MATGLIFIGVVILLVFLVLAFVIGGYNALVTLRNRYKNAYSQIDVQLKRRYDLIPNLVETAKGYLQHERGTLEAVITARNAAVSANTRAAQDIKTNGTFNLLANNAPSADLNELFRQRT